MTTITTGGPRLSPVVPIGASLPLVRVPFQDGYLLAAPSTHQEEGDRLVPLAPFCERLGIDTKWEIPGWEISERLIWAAARALGDLGFAAPCQRRCNERSRFTRPTPALTAGGAL